MVESQKCTYYINFVCLAHNNCHPCSVTNTKVNLTLFVISCKLFSGSIDLQCCKYCQLLSYLSSKFQSSMRTLHHKIVKLQTIPNFLSMIGMDFIQVSIIHNNISKLIHKNCHLKIYHIDTKYHLTMTIMFNVMLA